PRSAQDFLSLLHICSFQPHNHRNIYSDILRRLHDAGSHNVASHDAAENVDQNRSHSVIRKKNPKRVFDLLCGRAAADVEEVRGAAARKLDDVHCGHGQAGAVDHARHIAVELDVIQSVLAGFDLERIFFVQVAEFTDVCMTEQ